MQNLLLVMVGGGVGAGLRHLVNGWSLRLVGPGFPWGTMAINIVGSLTMGLVIGVLARRSGDTAAVRLFVATGILGGFTTFSAFSLDFATLWGRGAGAQALLYVATSVLGSLIAVFAGLWLMRSLG